METYGSPVPTANAQQEVSTPAILLIVTGALGVLFALLGVVQSLTSSGVPPEVLDQMRNTPGMEQWADMLGRMTSGPLSLLSNMASLALSGFVLFGGLKMKNLESWGLALAASILAVIPCCNGCCCLGLPAGIWALVVLNKPEVKAAFR